MKRNNLSITVAIALTAFLMLSPISAMSAPFDDDGNFDRAERMQMRLKVVERYLGIVESIHSISDDSEKTVLYQLQQLEDIYKKQRDPAKIVTLYQDVLKNTSNQTVRNAATMKLTQIYKRLGKDQAAEDLARNSLNENLKLLK
ncbi:hypothetical protein [Kaarinaea lacus]